MSIYLNMKHLLLYNHHKAVTLADIVKLKAHQNTDIILWMTKFFQ